MKYLPEQSILAHHEKKNMKLVFRILAILIAMITIYSILFHVFMKWEGRDYSWITGFYWTLSTMSTLGFGDITFESDLGKIFSILVLLSGILFLLIILPFTLIEFFYVPWMEKQLARRAPRDLPSKTKGHLILTNLDPVTSSLITRLGQFHHSYVVLVPKLEDALKLHDRGIKVVTGALDDPETYRKARVDTAVAVATTARDYLNTNVAFTVRECSPKVPIIATAKDPASVDILQLAGCNHVLQLSDMMGQALARRIIGNDAMTHVIGRFDQLLIAEANTNKTPLVGKTIREAQLRENVGINVVGIWERGTFQTPSPESKITTNTVLLLAGTQAQFDNYDEFFCIYNISSAPVVIIGGGRVARATARALEDRKIDYRIVEKLEERVRDKDKYIQGDAAELEVLKKAGLMESRAAVITTHDDDVNIYLTLYCRKLNPDLEIITRATHERNVATLHRAGSDFVLSYASMGANTIFNFLKRGEVVMVAEGLDVFRLKMPASLSGKTIQETSIRAETGASIIAVQNNGSMEVNPAPTYQLPADSDIVLIGDAKAEERFMDRYDQS